MIANVYCWGLGLYSWWSRNWWNAFACLGIFLSIATAIDLWLKIWGL